MGELDILIVHPDSGRSGYEYAMLTVLVTWLPLALAGVGLARWRVVHATMRGAGPLRMLARLAIAVQLAALAIPLLVVPIFLDAVWNGYVALQEGLLTVAIGSCVLLPIAAISAAGIIAWHRVLTALASREGEGRMLA